METSELLAQLRIDRQTPPTPSRSVLPWLLLITLVLLAAAGWWFWGKPKPVLVKIAPVIAQGTANPQASILDATGYVVARRQATVSAKVTGKVAEVLIEEGRRVEEGQIMARLDDVDAKAQYALADSQLKAAHALLADLQVQKTQAERELRRQQELIGRHLVSKQDAEQARLSVNSLSARLASQNQQIAVSQKSLQVAQVNLDNTIVRAPFTGIIVAKTAQPGEIVSPMSAGGFTRTGIGTLVDMDSLEIEVDVNEAFIGRVHSGQLVAARLNAYPEWNIPASVIAIIPTADRSKATVKVRIGFQQKDPRIVPEMGLRVAFLGETPPPNATPQPAGVLIPENAITRMGDTTSVFVYTQNRAERRTVTIGERAGTNRLIVDGLRAGEQVIVAPSNSLKDGDIVSVEP